MAAPKKYPDELRARAVQLYRESDLKPVIRRLAERLGQSGPTVSQTVARMERDGLLTVADNRAPPLENRVRAVTCSFPMGSGGVLVLVDQAAEDGCAADGVFGEAHGGWWIGLDSRWALCT